MTLKEFMARRVSLATLAIGLSLSSPAADVTIEKPYFRWLFGGFGFQNPEANFLSLMSEGFRDQRVLKTFAEIAPSFARVQRWEANRLDSSDIIGGLGSKAGRLAEFFRQKR